MPSPNFNLVKNIKFSVVGFIVNLLIVFISYKLLILQGGLETIGLWATLMAWIGLIRLGDVGMANASLHFIAKNDVNTPKEYTKILNFIDTGLILNLLFFLVLSFLGYFALNHYITDIIELDYQAMAINILPWMFVVFILLNVSSVVVGCLQGLHLGYQAVKISVLTSILQLGLVIALVPEYGLFGFAFAQIAQYGLKLIVLWWYLNKTLKRRAFIPYDFDLKTFKEMIGYSTKNQIANTINGMFEPVSKILVNHFGGLQAQGIYELAYKTVLMSRNAVLSGLTAALPASTRLLNTNKNEAKKLYLSTTKNVSIAIFILMLTVVLFAPAISWIWVGSFTANYWLFVSILALGFFLNSIGASAYNLGMASGVIRFNILSNSLAILSMTLIGYFLGNMYDELGVVISASLGFAAGGLLVKYLNEKILFHGSKKVEKI